MATQDVDLHIGDLILLHSQKHNGVLCAEGILDENLYVSENATVDDALFQITLQNQYSASREYDHFMSLHGTQDPSKMDNSTKRYLKALKRGCANESEMNENYMKQRRGSKIGYGETIQLFHIKSRKYITINPDALSIDERENLKVALNTEGNEMSWINVNSRFRVNRDGDPIKSGAELYLGSTNRENEYIHAAEINPKPRKQREVNCSLEKTSWKLTIYSSAKEAIGLEDEKLFGADTVVLFDPESISNLTIETLADKDEEDDGDDFEEKPEDVGGDDDAAAANYDAVTKQISVAYDQGDIVVHPLERRTDTNSLWLLEKEVTNAGGCINWRSEYVRFRHLNRGCYLAVDYHDHTGDDGQEYDVIYVTTNESKSEKTLFKANEIYNPGNLLNNGKALQLANDDLWLTRGDFVDEKESFAATTCQTRVNAANWLIKRYVPEIILPGQEKEPMDVHMVLAARKYLWDYHEMLVIPEGDAYPSVFPDASKADIQFFDYFMQRMVLFVQGHPISTDLNFFIEDIDDTPLRAARQTFVREQGLLQVLISLINQLIPISLRADEIALAKATARGAKRLLIVDPDFVIMGKQVLHQCFVLLYHSIKGHAVNQMYIADFMPVLLAHLGGGGQAFAGKCVNEMLSTNMELQETKIGTREIAIFIEKLRSGRMNPMYLGLLKSCCSCQGKGVDGNQCKVADMLFEDTNDIIINIHADYSKVDFEVWNPYSLYIPSVSIPGSPVLGSELLTKGLPKLSLSWTTASIDCSPLGLFGKLSVPLDMLYFKMDARSKAKDEDEDWLANPKRKGKKNSSSQQKANIADYFIEEMYLASEMCMDRNYVAMNKLSPLFPYEILLTIMRQSLSDEVKGAAINLLINLYVDCDPQAESTIPRLSRPWSELQKNDIPIIPSVDPGRVNAFAILQELISEYTQEMYRARWTPLSLNMLRLLRLLVVCDFYGSPTKLTDVIEKLVKALDRRGMVIDGKAADTEEENDKTNVGAASDGVAPLSITMGDESKEAMDEEDQPLIGDELEDDERSAEAAKESSWQRRHLNFLESTGVLIVIVFLVIIATSILVYEAVAYESLTSEKVPPSEDYQHWVFWVDKFITLCFFEVFYRMYLYTFLNGNLRGFFKDKLNILDLCLVLMDIFFMLPIVNMGNLAKPLRLFRAVRFTRILRAGRLVNRLMEGDGEEHDEFVEPSRYSKTPRVETQTMVQIVEVLATCQDIVDDRNLSLLLIGFYKWLNNGFKETPAQLFIQAIEDSKALNLANNNEDFDKIFIDSMMFNDASLVQRALDILVSHHSAGSTLLDNLKQTQLIIGALNERKYRMISTMLKTLESNAETQELWGELETAEDRISSKQTHDVIRELTELLQVRHQTLVFGEIYDVDPAMQDLFRNLGCFKICFKVFDLLETVEEEDDGSLEDIHENTKQLVKSCIEMFYWFIKNNPNNQELAFDELEYFFDILEEDIDASKIIFAIFENNETAMRKAPLDKIDEMVKAICVKGHKPEFLVFLKSILSVGEKNFKDNQFAVVSQVTAPSRLPKISSFLCDASDEVYKYKQELMKPYLGFKNLQLTELPEELQYHLNLLDVLSGCTIGRINVTALEAKVQSIYEVNSILSCLLDPEALLLVQIKMSLYFFNAVVEVEIMTPGLEYMRFMWDYIKTFSDVVKASREELERIAAFGWRDEDADRHIVEYMLVLSMIISGFFHRYYYPQEFSLTEGAKVIVNKDQRVDMSIEEIRDIILILHDELTSLYELKSPHLSSHQMVYIYDAVDGCNKALFPHSPPMPERYILAEEISGSDKIVSGSTAPPAIDTPAISSIDEIDANETVEEEYKRYFAEFVEKIENDPDVQETIRVESNSYISEVEDLPFSKTLSPAEVRYEPFVSKLVTHVKNRISIVNDAKELDSRCTRSTTWMIKGFRTMIENRWGMTIDERDDDGGEEQDEASAEVVGAFNKMGVTELCVELLSPGIQEGLYMECIKLLIAMLFKEGGATEVQQTIYDYLTSTQTDLFFQMMRKLTQDMIDWHKWHEIVELEEGEDPDLPEAFRVIRFMQLLCEGHFLDNQNILRDQPLNVKSINLLENYVDYINTLSRLPCRTSSAAADGVLNTILEVLQGPCKGNQTFFALNTDLIEIMNRLMRARTINDCDEEEELGIKITVVDIFQALLEGQVYRSEVYERVLSVIHFDIIQTLSEPTDAEEQEADGEEAEVSEEAQALQTECLVLLQMLADYKPELREELSLGAAEDVVGKDVGCVEVMWMQTLQRRFFSIPGICADLSKASKDKLIQDIDRSSNENKLLDFLDRSVQLYKEVKHQEYLKDFKLDLGCFTITLDTICSPGTQNAVSWTTFYLAFTINFLIIGYMEQGRKLESPDEVRLAITVLNIANIVLACITFVLTLIVKSPVIVEVEMEDGATLSQGLLAAAMDPMTVYTAGYITVSTLATQKDVYGQPMDYLLPFLMFDIIVKFPVAQDIINAVIVPRKMIGMTLLLGFFCIYIFAFLIFYYFPDDLNCWDCENTACAYDEESDDADGCLNDGQGALQCDTLWNCLLITLAYGLYMDGGIGDLFRPTLSTRLLIDSGFFVVIIVIMLNVIFGIIIDTFSERRTANAERLLDTTGVCFICGIDRQTFDRAADGPNGFKTHVKIDHNIWNYLYFIFYIWEQDKDDDDGLEYYVRHLVEQKDLAWFPMNKALRLNQSHTEDEIFENDLRCNVKNKFSLLDNKIDTMKRTMNTVVTKIKLALSNDDTETSQAQNGAIDTSRISVDSDSVVSADKHIGLGVPINVELEFLFLKDLPFKHSEERMMSLSCRITTMDGSLYLVTTTAVTGNSVNLDRQVLIPAADGITFDDERECNIEVLLGTPRDSELLGRISITGRELRRAVDSCLFKVVRLDNSESDSIIVFKVFESI